MARRQQSRTTSSARTRKVWLGGKLYKLAEDQCSDLDAFIQDGKVSDDQEQRALLWASDKGIEPAAVVTEDKVTIPKEQPLPELL